MNISLNTQAILLLTTWFSKAEKTDPKPLPPSEWGRFAQWLKENSKTPAGLLESGSVADYLNGWKDSKVTVDRIDYLLGRSMSLGLALEKWQRAGLWVMTRSDADYPSRLKKQLKADAPPVLFGCGNRQLLDKGGIAMVGSRDATQDQLVATTRIASETAVQGHSVVSGGARGVDETAMLGALEKEGTVIGILSDSLLRSATSAKYRNGLMSKNLVLISSFNPEAGFDVGNAMARNKYIYCLADAAIVVATGKGSGGTWNGALEDLKKGWVPLWVLPHPDKNSGNAALIQQGAKWLPHGDFRVDLLLDCRQAPAISAPVETSLFDFSEPPLHDFVVAEAETSARYDSEPAQSFVGVITDMTHETMTFYEFFIKRFATSARGSSVTLQQLLDTFDDINKAQLNDWIKRGVSEGRIRKLNKPVRYCTVKAVQQELNL